MFNKYGGVCYECRGNVKARRGLRECVSGVWIVLHKTCAEKRARKLRKEQQEVNKGVGVCARTSYK